MAVGAQEIASRETPISEPVGCRHLVITVHGIRTFGDWQGRLQALLFSDKASEQRGTRVRNYRYGYFSVIAFMIPVLRWLVTRQFREELAKQIEVNNPARVDIVAHSFGTHLVGWGLLGIPAAKRPKIHTIIFAGSVLKIGFPWRLLLGDGNVYRVINECGIRDRVLLLNQIFVLFTGMAGRIGFNGMEDKQRFLNRYYPFGHSGYFEAGGSESQDALMRDRWLPLLLGDSDPGDFDERAKPSAIRGATIFLLNNSEPVKLAMFVAPFLLLALWVNGLRRGAETARQAAVTAKNDAVAARNEAIASKNRAVKLADDNAKLAQTEKQSRERADQQSQLALARLKSVVFDIQTKLEGVPAAEDVRQFLLNTAIAGLEKVARGLDTASQADHALAWSHLNLGDTFLLIGGGKGRSAVELARQQYEAARQVAEELVKGNRHNAEGQRDLSASYNKLGDVSLQLGDSVAASDDYQKSLIIDQQLAAADPHSARAQRDLSVSYNSLGDVSLRLGDAAAARDDYQQSLKILRRLAAADPQNAQAQRDLSVSYDKLGDVSLQLGDAAASRDDYRQSLKIRQQLAAADPYNAQAKRDLSVSYTNLGEMSLQLGDSAAARDDFRESLKIAQQLAAADPYNAQAKRDLSISYNTLGSASLRLGDTAAARDDYQQSLKIHQELATADPRNAQAQRGLSISYTNLGDVSLQLGDAAAACEDYQQGLKIAQQLATADPHSAEAQRGLYLSCDRLGNVSLQLGDSAAARDAYRQDLKIAQQLAAADPANVEAQTDLAYSFGKLGLMEKSAGDFTAAAKSFQQSVAFLDKLERAGKIADQPLYRGWLKTSRRQLQLCTAAPRAIGDLAFVLKQPSGMVGELLAIRGRALARSGKLAGAAVAAEKLTGLDPKSGENLYWAAGVYAICSAADAVNPQAGVSPQKIDTPERDAAWAVGLLKQAHAAGYFKTADERIALKYDHDLDALRARGDFKSLLAEAAPPAVPASAR